ATGRLHQPAAGRAAGPPAQAHLYRRGEDRPRWPRDESLGAAAAREKVESSPFVEAPPEHPDHRHHWISPDLVAEIEFDGWTRDGTVGKAALKAVTDRPSFRH